MSDSAWPEPKQAPTHLGTIEYHDVGDGPPLVFLHLVLTEASHWDRMPPLLADRFRCIFPTLPMGAHRLPANADADLSVDGLARAVADLIGHLELDDVTIIGNDSGGAISQVMAANHPEVLHRVVLTNCDMYDSFPPKIFSYFNLFKRLPSEAFKTVGWTFKLEPLWKLPFAFGYLTNDIDGAKVRLWADRLLASKEVRRDLHAVFKGFGPEVTNKAAADLATTELPILVAWGKDDKAFKPALAERFVREVPTAELVWIDDCKTLVCWDQPERLAELIAEFHART